MIELKGGRILTNSLILMAKTKPARQTRKEKKYAELIKHLLQINTNFQNELTHLIKENIKSALFPALFPFSLPLSLIPSFQQPPPRSQSMQVFMTERHSNLN